MSIPLITSVVGTVAVFLGIYVVETAPQRIFALSASVFAIWLSFFSVEHETTGSFSRTGDPELASGSVHLTGVGHWPQSIEFTVREEAEERVVAEGLRLDLGRPVDERRIDGKRIGLELLSVDSDGFFVRLTNETGSWVQVTYLVKYSLLNDWICNARRIFAAEGGWVKGRRLSDIIESQWP